ncbi:hypothetical protein GRS80_15455 [Natrialba sp. INN-245]|nr:hypothetical protein [Natrialba sp. INN-245]
MSDRLPLSTDGSDTATVAVERAVDVSDRYDAQLHALYVAERTRAEQPRRDSRERRRRTEREARRDRHRLDRRVG